VHRIGPDRVPGVTRDELDVRAWPFIDWIALSQ
jgi:hypothetical protein